MKFRAQVEEELDRPEELDSLVVITVHCAREGVSAPSPQTVRERVRGHKARTPRMNGPILRTGKVAHLPTWSSFFKEAGR